MHSPAVRLRWEHFLGDGAGSMLACQSGHPLLLPSHELLATDCRAPQHTTVCSWYTELGQSKVPQPQPWGAQQAGEYSCFGKGQAMLLAAV